MRLTIDIRDKQEEKELFAFLDSRNYDYRAGENDFADGLTPEQEAESLRRLQLFKEGKMSGMPWEEVRKRYAKK